MNKVQISHTVTLSGYNVVWKVNRFDTCGVNRRSVPRHLISSSDSSEPMWRCLQREVRMLLVQFPVAEVWSCRRREKVSLIHVTTLPKVVLSQRWPILFKRGSNDISSAFTFIQSCTQIPEESRPALELSPHPSRCHNSYWRSSSTPNLPFYA